MLLFYKMSKQEQFEYSVLNQATYSNNARKVLDEYDEGDNFMIMKEETNYLVVRDTTTNKVVIVAKGTDLGNTKGMKLQDLKEDLHIVLNKPETMGRLREIKNETRKLIKAYGKNNVIISGHSLGGYITADISKDLDIKGVAFNIGSSPKKITPTFNKNLTHYTTNSLSNKVIDPLSITSSSRDFYNKKVVEPKNIGSGVIRFHTISHFLPNKKDKKKDKMFVNNKMAKDLDEMKTGELQMIAKSLGIKNPKKYKKKNKDKNTLGDLKRLIREKEGSGSEADNEEEGKYDEGASEKREKEREERLIETNQEEMKDEDLIDETLKRIPKRSRKDQLIDTIKYQRRPGDFDMIRADELKGGLTNQIRNMRQMKLPKLTDKQLQQIQQRLGYSMEKMKEFKGIYDKYSKGINKQTLEDGSWVSNLASTLGAPEVKLFQAGINAIGLGFSKQDKDDWKKMLDGEDSGLSSSRQLELGLKAILNPDMIGSTITHQVKKEVANISRDWNDMVSGKAVRFEDDDEGVKQGIENVEQRQREEMDEIGRQRDLASYKGQDTSEFDKKLQKDERIEDLKRVPKFSDFGGKDDTTFGQKFNKFMNHFNPFSGPLNNSAQSKLDELLAEFKRDHPDGYERYMRKKRKHETFARKNEVGGRNSEIAPQHLDMVQGLKDIMLETLKANKKLRDKGEEGFLSDSQIEAIDKLYQQKSKGMKYHDLTQMYIDFQNSYGEFGDLPQEIRNDITSYQVKDQNELGSRGSGDIDLGIGGDREVFQQDEDKKSEEADRIKRADEAMKAQKEYEQGQDYADEIKLQEIDAENEKTNKQRRLRDDVIHPGFVETNTNKPELRPKIIFGNTDAQYYQPPDEVRREREQISQMSMWKCKNMTEDHNPESVLYKRQQSNEKLRFSETIKMPSVPSGFGNIPESFLKYNQRVWIPVFARKSESLPMLCNPDRVQYPFKQPEPENNTSTSEVEQMQTRPNIFPEPYLQGYKGKYIANNTRGFNYVKNNRYLVNK